jgi:hypothetical protein
MEVVCAVEQGVRVRLIKTVDVLVATCCGR